ncbi:MAG: serine hydrolase [Alphaproteobacteria bacterium]|nr:serine hydrolase [Alphaproteobacteria bacterium]
MNRIFFTIFLTCFAFWPCWGNDRAPLNTLIPALETYINKAMSEEGVPGACVVIVKDGKIVYLKGFGVKVLGGNDPVDGHTPFAVASGTKNFTNTLVARLVDQGKIQWNDLVIKYLPDFALSDPKITQSFTIEDLLSHRSGLPDFSADTLVQMGWSADEIKAALKHIPIEGEFRKTYDYQNVIVGLVGFIIENVTGKPLAQVYQEEIFDPIGLKETRLGQKEPLTLWQKIKNLFGYGVPQPTYHDTYNMKTRNLPNGNPCIFTFPASSGIISTGYDIGQWLIFQLNNAHINGKALVSEENINRMRTPHVDVPLKGGRQFPTSRVTKVNYGLGWFLHDYAGTSVLNHMGGMTGTRSLIFIIPEEKLGFAILLNFGGLRVTLFPEAIRNKFLDLYLKVKDEQDWAKILREAIANHYEKFKQNRQREMLQNLAPPRDLEDYAGSYENPLYGKIIFNIENNALILHYRDRSPVKLSHWNGNTFYFNGSDLSSGLAGTDLGEITFSHQHGKSNRLMISLLDEGQDRLFNRVE